MLESKLQKQIIISTCYLVLSAILFSCSSPKQVESDNYFITETRCHITPIKDQGNSETCWIYAMLSTIESNRIAMGDSVNISPVYFERMLLQEEAEGVYMRKGGGEISRRGMIPHCMTLFDKYGAFAYDSYRSRSENKNMSVLAREVKLLAKNDAARCVGLDKMRSDALELLDREIAFLPRFQFFCGSEYTPQQFGRSVVQPEDYEYLGADYPFPDRRITDVIRATPPDSLLLIAQHSLEQGKAVCWEGDISEEGFDWNNGVADLSQKELKKIKSLSAEDLREKYRHDIETFRTTDDHAMSLCGISHDKHGRKYFICKNSWGTSNRFKGLMFMSFEYFLCKTVLIASLNTK